MRIQVQEANRTPSYLNARRPSTRHIILKLSRVNDKERILKAVRLEKIVHYKGSSIRSSSDFSAQTLQARSAWTHVFKMLKDRNHQPGIVSQQHYPFHTKEKQRLSETKTEGVCHHQTCVVRNAGRSSST